MLRIATYLATLAWHGVEVVEPHARGPHTRGPHVALAVGHDEVAEVNGLEDGAGQGCNVQNIRDWRHRPGSRGRNGPSIQVSEQSSHKQQRPGPSIGSPGTP